MSDGSIWSTIETDAWSRDFDYENYRLIHAQFGCSHTPLTLDTYNALCHILDIEYEDSLE